jgi:hypothetical protein
MRIQLRDAHRRVAGAKVAAHAKCVLSTNITHDTESGSAAMFHEQQLQRMNKRYVAASLAGDVDWYRMHLADEFVCIESDGSLLNKEAFLRLTAKGCSDLADYRLDDVDVQFYGDVALVRALGSWTMKTGACGISRYIDVYVRNDDEWKVVSAQITRANREPDHAAHH